VVLIGKIIFRWLCCLAVGISLANAALADSGAATRYAEIRQIEHLQDRRLRAYLSVFESSGTDGVRYPIATLDRSAIQFFTPDDPDQPLGAESLWTYATLAPPRPRATVIVFHDSNDLSVKLATEVRKSVAENLPAFRSDFLTVLASGGGRVAEIATLNPVQSENIKALQRKINASQSLGSENGSALALCGALDQYVRWQELGVEAVDQKSVILIGPPGDPYPVARESFQKCWIQLRTMGVRIFHVAYQLEGITLPANDKVASMSEAGTLHQVQTALDVFPALSNVASILNDEYVVEFSLPKDRVLAPQEAIFARISYHGNVFASAQKSAQIPMAVVISTLPDQPEEEKALNERPPTWWFDVLLVVGALVAVILLGRFIRTRWRLQRETRICNSCGARVVNDFSNCPFRHTGCVAKLTVLSGPHLGRQYPLFLGRNSIGSGRRCTIQIRGNQGIRRRHAFIEIKNERAQFSTLAGQDRVNGWLVHEPRLIGSGSVIALNGMQLFFEIRPEKES